MTGERSGPPPTADRSAPAPDDEALEVVADADASSGYGRRVSAFALDQAISGGSNVLLVVVAARLLDVDGFARVSIAFLVYGLVVVVARSLIGIPVLMYPAEAGEQEADVVGSAWAIGLATGALTLVGAVATSFADRSLGLALGVLGLLAPALVLQDVGRFLAFTTRRVSRAVVLDVVWLVAAAVAITAVHLLDLTSATWFVAAWAGSGAVAAVLVHAYWPASPVPRLAWLRVTRRASALTLVETIILQTGALALIAVAGLFAGRQFIAGFAGAQVLARPMSLILQAMSASGVSEVAHQGGRRPVVRAAVSTSAIATAGCALVCAVVLAIPDDLGVLVLGDNWYPTELLLWPFTAYMLAEAVSCGPHAALRGLHRLTLLVVISIAWTGLAIVVTGLGYELGGGRGIIWGIAAARIVYVAVLVAFLAGALRQDPAGGRSSRPSHRRQRWGADVQ